MPHFIRVGKRGLNLDQILYWEDGYARDINLNYLPRLSVAFAASYDVADNISGVVTLDFFDGERLALLAYLENEAETLLIPQPSTPPTKPAGACEAGTEVAVPHTDDIPF